MAMTEQRKTIQPAGRPASRLPLSPGIAVGGFIFVSGQVPVDPETGQVPEGIEAQTRLVLENVRAVLAAAGAGPEHVVKATVYLTNIEDFAGMNRAYGAFFPGEPPTRTTVEVSALARPEFLVEIEVIAYAGS